VWQQERVLNFDYFPNPFTDQLDIKFNHVLDSDADLEVLDVFGRLLDSGSLVKGTDHITLKGEKYPDGALVIKITQNDGEVASFKAVKMK
ncbi:MAG: T9SS type A sorting domain-containing protein, partial [Chitinophagales bacterium]|nr:T9SS type A sorting domain-containing protein [Chitinophagales bacterium]